MTTSSYILATGQRGLAKLQSGGGEW